MTTPSRLHARFDAPTARSAGAVLATLLATVVTGCVADDTDYGETTQAATVSSYATSSCTTAVVLGLSKQIADQMACEDTNVLRRFDPSSTIELTSNAVLPYLSPSGLTALQNVAASRMVEVNSAFRTIAQQYLIYRWYSDGRCGITAAAQPGRSNHETGRALDLQNYSSLVSAMSSQGWSHNVSGDPVHFDHLASPDARGKDIEAFQRLWNRNHPDDTIGVDGDFGPATRARLEQAPATGFTLGAMCGTGTGTGTGTGSGSGSGSGSGTGTGSGGDTAPTYLADVVAVDGPDRVQPQTRAQYAMTIQNDGTATWPATAVLALASATTSQLHDTSWLTTTEIVALDGEVGPGATAHVVFSVMTPAAMDELPISETLAIVDGTQRLGIVQLSLTVVPGITEPESSDADDQFDQEITAGCSSTSGSSGALMVLVVLSALVVPSKRRGRATRSASGQRSTSRND